MRGVHQPIFYSLISVGMGLYVSKLIRYRKDFVVAGQQPRLCLGIATVTNTERRLITFMVSSQKALSEDMLHGDNLL